MMTFLDDFWERLKARSRRLREFDSTPEATHVGHALVTVLLFGTIGVGLAMMIAALGLPAPLATGLRWGVIAGLAFYVVRELANRTDVTHELVCNVRGLRWLRIPYGVRFDWRWQPWDGLCDIVVPLWVCLPVLLGSLWALWLLSLAVTALYLLFRPYRSSR
jgi:hypothetical protein